MSGPLYDASVPVFTHTLSVILELLSKGEGHARKRGFDPDLLLAYRGLCQSS
jgi:hypothetical protein